ncbi:MAG: hypothetical protein KF716_07135 [Anaerolineae bacterium]|nr:hypothetical protein [Anaerolineae bacterium]
MSDDQARDLTMNNSLLRSIPTFAMFILFGIVLLGLGVMARSHWLDHPNIIQIVPTNTGQPERCLTCHAGIESIGASHPVEQFGCVSCHGGDGLAVDAEAAHTGVVRNPGDLAVADKYCASCHPAQTALVPRSIMATYAGAIALVRRAFGLQTDDQAHVAITAIDTLAAFTVQDSDPAPIQKFQQNCLTCHLHAEPLQQTYFYRSTGCSSCHVLYDSDGLYKGNDPTIPKEEPGHASVHTITRQIPYTQCNHCHNRGNYDLRSMEFVARTDMPAPHTLSDDARRLLEYYQPIGQFTRCEYELDCIDCHTKLEVMGDGILHSNKVDAQYTRCYTCHGTSDSLPPQVDVGTAFALATPTTPLKPNASAVLITERGEVLSHVQQVDGQWLLTSKVDGKTYPVPMVKGSQCQQKPDEQNSRYCHECHSVDRDAVLAGNSP